MACRLEPYAGSEPQRFADPDIGRPVAAGPSRGLVPVRAGRRAPLAGRLRPRRSVGSRPSTRPCRGPSRGDSVAVRAVPRRDERPRDVRRRPLPRPRTGGRRHLQPRLQPGLPPVLRLRRPVLVSADAGREPPAGPDRGRRAAARRIRRELTEPSPASSGAPALGPRRPRQEPLSRSFRASETIWRAATGTTTQRPSPNSFRLLGTICKTARRTGRSPSRNRHQGRRYADLGREAARSLRIRCAASLPGAPMTQPPGCVPEPHW